MGEKISTSDDFRNSLKSLDTEEWFDLKFYRPIGYRWALMAKRLGITPNAITIASIFIGLASGCLFYFTDIWLNLAGCLLLMLADSFDSADGQLARMTKQYSRIGRILDGVSGDVWFAAICLRENASSDFFSAHAWVIWVVAVATGVFHGVQAAMADYYRQFHLYFLKGEEGSELDSASDLWDKFRSLSVGQEKRTPWMQRLRRVLAARYGHRIPQSFREEFRQASKPLMKYTNILSFNTRTFALFAALLIFRMPWLYFAFELTVLNILLIYMVVRHERICRRFTLQLEKQ